MYNIVEFLYNIYIFHPNACRPNVHRPKVVRKRSHDIKRLFASLNHGRNKIIDLNLLLVIDHFL